MPGLVPPVADERAGLLAYLDQQRQALKLSAYGLDDDQARLTPTAGSLSVGGLIKHCAVMETQWTDTMLQRAGQPVDYAASFRLEPGESLAEVIERYDAVGAATAAAVALVTDLGDPVPVPQGVPWFPADVAAWSVRWVLLHVIEETARHAGHADIVRESIDGATAFPLMAAAEGWPETPWMKPWRPQHPPVSTL
ncbi:DinB family protein [Catellatospora sp. KI3]|uniref:DinB family protein n=1 Tax=Catellatospora sp. KI3 TaxID=3041620 RepID=UPI0024828ADB|nr:DinB family protein [Catellatospora sp. KI3]MDI1465003.1 DinB family protein [Catellatospora sp. KI3]